MSNSLQEVWSEMNFARLIRAYPYQHWVIAWNEQMSGCWLLEDLSMEIAPPSINNWDAVQIVEVACNCCVSTIFHGVVTMDLPKPRDKVLH